MSKLYFKHTFEYDVNDVYPERTTIYELINNTLDTRTYFNKYGNIIQLNGSEDYIKKLIHILKGEICSDIISESISYNEFNSIFNNPIT